MPSYKTGFNWNKNKSIANKYAFLQKKPASSHSVIKISWKTKVKSNYVFGLLQNYNEISQVKKQINNKKM